MTASSYGNLPKLSVIMAVRNAAGTVEHALDSLVLQHYPKLEVIVWDGLSSDGTQDVLARYPHLITTLISEQDSGPPDACNRAAALASGDYIGYLNADDEMLPGMLWAMAEEILRQPQVDVISAGMLYRTVNRQGRRVVTGYYAGDEQLALTLKNILSELPTFALSRFIRRDLALKIGPYNTDPKRWYISNDREWIIRLALSPCRSVVIPQALYCFNINTKSISSNPDTFIRIIDEHLMIADALLAREDLTESQRNLVARWRSRQFSFGFWKMFATLRWGNAINYARTGMRSGGWRWLPATLWLMISKVLRRMGLMLSKGIDRGGV